jgi:hypothetical protein
VPGRKSSAPESIDEGEKTMNIKLNALCLGGFLALTSLLAQPAMADEWNKKIEFQFSGPVQIPGKVLAAGKYVFQLVDNDANRNIVQVFSEDSNGKQSLVATLLAIPDFMSETSYKPIVHFEERPSGMPEAIHSWFYPGENTGWEFVYPKGETLRTSANATPAPAPVTADATPTLPDGPQVEEAAPSAEQVTAVEEELADAQNDLPAPPSAPAALMPAPEADFQVSADRMLPETAGSSGLELMVGLAMLVGGLAAVAASLYKSQA